MPENSKLALNAGELSDELAGRIDLQKFNSGCEILENARVLRAGGVSRRAGFEYIGEVNDQTRKARLVGLRFSESQGFCLELSHYTMRVIQDGVISGTTYTTPWTEDQVFDLQFAQRVDRIVVTHPEVPVHNILRFNDGTWAVSGFPWVKRVWELYPTTGTITMTPGATTGTTTITSDTGLFDDTWVGDRIRIDHQVSEDSSEYILSGALSGIGTINLSNTDATVGEKFYQVVDGLRDFYTCIADYNHLPVPPANPAGDYTGSTNLADYPNFFEKGVELVPETSVSDAWVFETFGTWKGTYWVQRSFDDGNTWTTIKAITSNDNRNERVVEEESESVKIRVVVPRFEDNYSFRSQFTVNSFVQSGSAVIIADAGNTSTQVAVTVEEDFHSTQPSTVWYECAYSPRNGYPRAVTFYQGRLALAGTKSRPQTVWLSRTQQPFDFTIGSLATDGMSLQTDAEGYEDIAWLSSHLSLLVGTTLGVWAISSPDGSSLSPESNSIRRQMQLGAEKKFQAMPVQNNVLFLQYKGRKVQELTGGSVEYGGYLSADLTQLATHVTRGGVTQITTGELPDATLFMVSGGEVAVLTYERAQNVVGWARWVTGGSFTSFATTAGAAEDDDHYAIIDRNGKRFIERMAPDMLRVEEDNDVANLRFLDCYTERIETAEFGTITGLTRFEGREVETFIDGEPYGAVTVTGGVATLPHPGKNVIVGLPYTTEVRPMPIDFGVIGSKSAAIELIIRFRNSLGGEVSQDRERWSTVEQLQPRITTDTPLSLLSQDYQSTPHSTWDRKPSISVRQTQPFPMTILAMRVKTKTTR